MVISTRQACFLVLLLRYPKKAFFFFFFFLLILVDSDHENSKFLLSIDQKYFPWSETRRKNVVFELIWRNSKLSFFKLTRFLPRPSFRLCVEKRIFSLSKFNRKRFNDTMSFRTCDVTRDVIHKINTNSSSFSSS